MTVHFTDAELTRLGGHLVRLYVEVERGLRRPQDLRRYVTPELWAQLFHGHTERHPEAGLVTSDDVGRIAMSRHGDGAAYIAAAARVTDDQWTALSLELRVQHNGRWKVAQLSRVRQASIPQRLSEPSTARPADLAVRMHTVVSDLVASRKALSATEQRLATTERQIERGDQSAIERRDELNQEADRWTATVRGFKVERDEVQERMDQRKAIREQFDPPRYLTRLLGSQPERDHPHAALWHVAASAVERYRTEADITDPNSALGPIPADKHLRLLRTHTVATIRDIHRQIRETGEIREAERSAAPAINTELGL